MKRSSLTPAGLVLAALLAAPGAWAAIPTDRPATDGRGVQPASPVLDPAAAGETLPDALADAGPLAVSPRSFELARKLTFALQAEPDASGVEAVAAEGDQEKLNPGRAVLLSAIIPGAGEMYAGSTIKAVFFFGLEVTSWAMAISYAQQGKDKQDEYQAFAESHYLELNYRNKEYEFAGIYRSNDPFTGTQADWETLPWDQKIEFLPPNFTHELSKTHNQSYYENIGKYTTQFGFGWDDQTGDDQDTPYVWDGKSPRMEQYIDMRYDSNRLLDRSATFLMVVMANHVVSALDAGFTVRAKNRKLAEVEVGMRAPVINDIPVAMGSLRVTW